MNRRISARAMLIAAAIAACMLTGSMRAAALGFLVPDDASYEPLELQSQVMDVRIDNQSAQTHIKQVFYNRHGRPIEATYLLPVPKGAHVTDFVMEMGGKKVRGEVLEREKARQIYTDIVRRVRDPGLLEYVDQQIFRARVFPIPPGKPQQVEITVTHLLPMDNGIVEYEWPFDAPRVIAQRGRAVAAGEFDLKLDIRSKTPILTVYSPTHKVRVERESDNRAKVRLDETPGRDEPVFRCYYTLSDKAVGLNALTARREGADGAFLLLVSPGRFYDEAKLPPIDFTFVLDSSGSMADDNKIEAARKALKYCLSGLREVDGFNIIRFSSEVEPFESGFIDASAENVNRAKTFVDGLRAAGGTFIDGALSKALEQKPRKDRLHTILFITDGMPTVGVTDVDTILANVRKRNEQRLRIFVCGVGYDVNTRLLDRLADETRAVVQYIRPKEDLEVAVSQLFDKVSRPVLTNLRVDWGGLEARDVYPKDLPDLFAGSQLTIFGRYKNGGSRAIALYGKVGGDEKKFVYEANFRTESHDKHAFVETLWAIRRVGYLLDQIRTNGESAELRDEVIELAKKHGIVTPYTSYLVQEDQPRVAMGPQPPDRGHLALGQPVQQLDSTRALGRAGAGPAAVPVPGVEAEAMGRTTYGMSRGGGGYGGFGGGPGDASKSAAEAQSRGWILWSGGPDVGDQRQASESLAAPQSDGFTVYSGGQAVRAPASGQVAVEISKGISEMKTAATIAGADSKVASTRVVAGRTFNFVNGVWVEAQEKKLKEPAKEKKTLKIKYLSDAYFDLVKLRPDLKSVFALGERIELDIGDFHVVIGPEGDEKISPSLLERLKKL